MSSGNNSVFILFVCLKPKCNFISSRSRTLSEGPDGKLIVDNEKSDDDFNKDDKTSGYSSEIGGAESVQGDLSACN